MARLYLLFSLAAILSFTVGVPLEIRQEANSEVVEYIKQIRSALTAIDSIRANDASRACADGTFQTTLSEQAYDRELVLKLLCEEAASIDIFPDLDRAEREFQTAWEGLSIATADFDGERFCRENVVDVDALDNAGLDGTKIREIICRPRTQSATSVSRTFSPLGSMSSTSSQTAVSNPSSNAQSETSSAGPASSTSQVTPSSNGADLNPASSISQQGSPSSCSLQLGTISGIVSATSSSLVISSSTPTSTTSRSLSGSGNTEQATRASSTSASSADDITVIFVTTFVTLTVTPTPSSPSQTSNSTDSATFAPLSFSRASRIIPEQPAFTVSDGSTSSDEPTWIVGPPLSFPNRHSSSNSATVTDGVPTMYAEA